MPDLNRPSRDIRLDVIRGMALLAILAVNIYAFGRPAFAELLEHLPNWAVLDTIIALAFNGKAVSLLTLLLGMGIWTLSHQSVAGGRGWRRYHIHRAIWLGLIGVTHFALLFWGDILLTYAFAMIVITPLVRRSVRTKLAWAAALWAAQGPLIWWFSHQSIWVLDNQQWLERASNINSSDIHSALYLTWTQQVQERLQYHFSWYAQYALMLAPATMSLMLVGMCAAQGRWLARPRAMWRRVGGWFGPVLVLAAAGSLAVLRLHGAAGEVGFYLQREVLAPVLAMGYLLGLSVWLRCRPIRSSLPLSSLARVGQMPLTCYLLMSLLGTTIFYRWGWGWFGQLSSPALLATAGLIMLVTTTFASLWLANFRTGPVEWLWRKLAWRDAHAKRGEVAQSTSPQP
jgi:uncharacterized protein